YSQFEHAGDSFMRNRKHATDKSSCVNRFQKLLDDEQTASQAHPTIARLFHRPNEPLAKLAGATGLEPAASCVTGRRSNPLNYAPALKFNSLGLPHVPPSARRFPRLPENAVTAPHLLVTN